MVFKVTVSFNNETKSHFIESESFLFGRSEEADILCPHKGISRNHLEVFAKGHQIFIQDLGTSNGTRLGGSAIAGDSAVLYQPGTPIQLGTCDDAVFIELLVPSHKAVTPEEVIKKAKEEADEYWEQVRHQAQDTRTKAEESAEELVKQAHLKIVQDQEAAHRKTQSILEKAQAQALEKLTEADAKAQSVLKAAGEKAQTLTQQAADRATQEYNQLKERYKAESEKYWGKLVADAQERARGLVEQKVQEKEREWQTQKDQELARLREELRAQFEKEVAEKRKGVEEQVEKAIRQVEALKREKAEVENSVAELRKESQEIETSVQRHRTEMSDLKIELESLERNRGQITEALKQVESSKQEREREIAQLQLELRNRKVAIEEEFQKINSDALKRKQNLEDEIRQLSAAKEKSQEEIESQLSEQSREVEKRLTEILAKVEQAQAELEKSQSEVQRLEDERKQKVKSMESVMEEFLHQEKKLERLHSEFEKHKAILIQNAHTEAVQIREQAQAERRRAMSALESEIAERRERLHLEIESMREDAASRFKVSKLWPFSRRTSQDPPQEEPSHGAALDFDEKTPIVQLKDLDLSDTREIGDNLEWDDDTQITTPSEDGTTDADNEGSAEQRRWPLRRIAGTLLLLGAAALASYKWLPAASRTGSTSLAQPAEPHFRETYTENLLYTDQFFERYTSKSFQDGWLVSVHSYLADEFGFSKEEVARLIALEVQLVKELKEILDSTPQEEAETVMIAKEVESSQAMKDLFTSDDAFSGFKAFQEQYYNEFFRIRGPAHESSAE